MEAHEGEIERGRQLSRVNAFSDGIFTIAATLLVLSIDLPSGPASELGHELRDLVEPTLAYFLSFAVIGVFWTRHHQLFGRLRYSTARFAALNLAFLSFVALLPAPTELVGRYGDETAPTVIYALNIVTLSLLLHALVRYAETNGLSDVEVRSRAGAVRANTALVAFSLSIPVAFASPSAAQYIWGGALILPAFLNRRG